MMRMRSYLAACCLAVSVGLAIPVQAANSAASFDLQSANVAQVLQLLYGEALSTPYVLDPEVLSDTRTVSFRYKSGQGDLQAFLDGFLDSLGYVVERKGGVDFVRKRKTEDVELPEARLHLYRPQYRDVAYLARVMAPLFKGSFSVNRSVRAFGPGHARRPCAQRLVSRHDRPRCRRAFVLGHPAGNRKAAATLAPGRCGHRRSAGAWSGL